MSVRAYSAGVYGRNCAEKRNAAPPRQNRLHVFSRPAIVAAFRGSMLSQAKKHPLFHWVWLTLFLATFDIPYFFVGWWKFIPATLLIVLLGEIRYPGEGLKKLGLWIPRNQFFLILVVLLSVYALSAYWGSRLLADRNISVDSSGLHLGWVLFPLFQAGNEEMLFRGLFLSGLTQAMGSATGASLFSAIVFVLAHAAFYPLTQGGALSIIALLSLFFLALSLNRIYFRFSHIGFTFAIHAGWNLFQYGGNLFVDNITMQPIPEAALFNVVVGSPIVLSFCIVLWCLTWFSLPFAGQFKSPA